MELRWKKSLGQHLLHDRNILKKIVSALPLTGSENVVEIGCGTGVLTDLLVREPVRITGIELDKQFFDILRDKFSGQNNFRLITGNFLTLDLREVFPEDKKTLVVGNLPYNVTSQILFRLFSFREYIESVTVMMQKEVSRRITAKVRTKDRGILSVVCQFHAEPEVLFPVSRNCFYPRPNVDSAVVALKFRNIPGDVDPDLFFRLVKTCFGKRRKQLRNSISIIDEADIGRLEPDFDLDRRPEELEVHEFADLTRTIFS
ncbi:16S rRNA (adenine(1518)-N(6)/adenine(1519)-N(6))-dimethyltransferase RsmA [candidate division KSB1 bacterium]